MSIEATNPDSGVTEEAAFDKLESLLSGNQPGDGQDHEEEESEETAESSDKSEEKPDEESQADPLEDVEIEGEVFQMPAKVKKLVEMGTGFYQKTQALAEQRKALESQHATLKQQGELMAVGFEKAVELKEIKARIAQFDQLDWHALVDQDPTQATKLNLTLQQLQRQAAAKEAELSEVVTKHQATLTEGKRKALEDGMRLVKQAIPKWDSALAKKVEANTKSYGFSDAELSELTDPRFVIALHDAAQWKALQASKSTVTKKVASAGPVKTTARTAAGTQSADALKAAKARLAKTGSDRDAEDFLDRLFKVK